jgi:sulfatase modifying factor 1
MAQKIEVRSKVMRGATVILFATALMASAPSLASNPIVELGDFKIDLTEVSIGRFAEYAQRKGIQTEAERSGGGFEYVMGWQNLRISDGGHW